MSDVKVLLKRTCSYAQTKNLVYVKQFLIVSENGERKLALRLVNERAERVTAVTVSIALFGEDGDEIGVNEVRLDVPQGAGLTSIPFVPERKITVSDNVGDCNIKVVCAEYGDYTYRADGKNVNVEYNGGENNLDDHSTASKSKNVAKAGKDGITVTRKTLKIPLLVVVALFIAFAFTVGAIIAHLLYFVNTEKTFLYSGVEYAFEDDDRSDGSNIYVVGYYGSQSRVVIPKSIEGHTVTHIADGAFKNDRALTSISFASNLPVGEGAFENCTSLRTVDFEHITEIGAGAFRNCSSLTSVTITPVIAVIPQETFLGCTSLSSVIVTESDELIQIGGNAFSFCTGLKNVDIARRIDYGYRGGVHNWFVASNVGRLHLLEFDITLENNTVTSLFGISLSSGDEAQIGELIIDSLDAIPESFCMNTTVTSFTVKQTGSSVIPDYAFFNCHKLAHFDINVTPSYVGDYAFYNTAMTAFDGNALEYLGTQAFECSDKLVSFTLSQNTFLTEIGMGAFKCCTSLSSFTLPIGITEIKASTFESCSSLAEVKFARGASITLIQSNAFYGCAALGEFKLPDDELTYIGASAFEDCTALKSFDVTEKVFFIDDYAFSGCTSFTQFTVPETVLILGRGAFADCTALEQLTVPFVGNTASNNGFLAYTFGAVSSNVNGNAVVPVSLKTVNITKSSALSNNAFYGCSDLQTVNLPDSLTQIGDYAFYACSSLKSIDIPESVNYIGARAFYACSFTELTVPDGVTFIGFGAFEQTALEQLTVPFVGSTQSDDGYFAYTFGAYNYGSSEYIPSSLKVVNITNTTIIPAYAFCYASYIEEINLPDMLTNIGRESFINCMSLTKLYVPNSVLYIGGSAFSGCENLAELTVPFVGMYRATSAYSSSAYSIKAMFNNNVPRALRKVTVTDSEYIVENAFENARYIEQIVLDCDVKSISEFAFRGCYRLFEVFNYSALDIVKGASDCGGIAEYALKVHTDRDEEPLAQFVSADGYRFVRDDDGNYYMIDYEEAGAQLSLPDAVSVGGVSIGAYSVWQFLFYENYDLQSVTIPAAVVDIGRYAFAFCGNLESVKYAATSTVTAINEYTFYYCVSLYDLAIPAKLSLIGSYAFSDCTRLKKFDVRESLTENSICDYAFNNCVRLFEIYNYSSLDIVEGSTDYGRIAEHARVVHINPNDSIDSVIVNDVQYMKLRDNGIDWWAVDYYGTNGSLTVSSFTYNGSKVTNVGIYSLAFTNYYNITSVTVSNAVAELTQEIFSNCYNIESIMLIDDGGANAKINIGENAFRSLDALVSFKSDVAISSIGENAFAKDGRLKTVVFNKTVDIIKSNAFTVIGESSLSFKFADVGIIESNAFGGSNLRSATFGNVTTVGDGAFSGCYNLVSVSFGDVDSLGISTFERDVALRTAAFGAVKTVGEKAFYGDSALTSVTFAVGQSMYIGDSAFENASALTAFAYSGYISYIGARAFYNNYRLKSVGLGSVGEIGAYAFVTDTSLATLTFSGNVDKIGNYAFSSVPISTLSFGGNVGEIGDYAFSGNTYLNSLSFIGDVGSIGNGAFTNNSVLSRLEFNGKVGSIGDYAFSGIIISELVLPEPLTRISDYAFASNVMLNYISLPKTLTAVSENAFSGCNYILSVYYACNPSVVQSVDFGDVLVMTDVASKAKLEYATVNQFEFVKTVDYGWYLYRVNMYDGILLFLPQSFTVNGVKTDSYKIRQYAISFGSVNILIPKAVTAIHTHSLSTGSARVYYAGTQAEWAELTGDTKVASMIVVYYYSDCLHDDDGKTMWRYADDGYPTHDVTVFADSEWIVTKQPTCEQEGITEVTCKHCGRKFTEALPHIDHIIGADGKCTMCGRTGVNITSDNIDDFDWFDNDSDSPFEISTDGTIKSTNKERYSTSVFTITADSDMTVKFYLRASSRANSDIGIVALNGEVYRTISGIDQTDFSFSMKAGDVLTITYSRGGGTSYADDCIYITDLTVIYWEAVTDDNA